jgi:hypothetical protein
MSDDGPTDASIVATTFQGLAPNGVPCILEMLVMGFGLCNAPTNFPRLMTPVLDPFIHFFVIVCLDDICIYSNLAEEHLDNLRKIFVALRENIIFIKMIKCSGLNEKPSILISSLEVTMFEYPNQRLKE